MSMIRRTLFTALTALAFAALPGQLSAQDHATESDGASTFGEDFPHGVTFWTRREPVGCWLCEPAIDINYGLYQRSGDVAEDISENFLRLQEDLTDTEDKISAARRYYNSTVMHFNTAVQSVPWILLARPLGFREREFFSADGDTAPPEVSFAS